MNKQEANDICGGLTETKKMPCPSYSTPAQACQVGSKLVSIKGSVCHGCYALKGFYRFKQGISKREQRLATIYKPQWVEALVTLIGKRNEFRWHDSGDIQSIMHLCNIMEVARLTSDTKHWIPTREYGYVRDYVTSGKNVPANMYVRLSGLMVNGSPPTDLAKFLQGFDNVEGFIGVSSVATKHANNGDDCPAYNQGGKCGSCRKCWSTHMNVTYPLH
jgi:hypothetical protein